MRILGVTEELLVISDVDSESSGRMKSDTNESLGDVPRSCSMPHDGRFLANYVLWRYCYGQMPMIIYNSQTSH